MRGFDRSTDPLSLLDPARDIHLNSSPYIISNLTLSDELTVKQGLLYVSIIVKNAPFHAMLDTGANISCASAIQWDYFQSLGIRLYPTSLSCTIADSDSPAEICGYFFTNIQISDKTWYGKIFLIKRLPYQFILGRDIMTALDIFIDNKGNRLYFSKEEIVKEVKSTSSLQLYSLSSIDPAPFRFNGGTAADPYDPDDPELVHRAGGEDSPDFTFQIDHPYLTAKQMEEGLKLLSDWQDRFKDSPGLTSVMEYKIYWDEKVPPVRKANFRMSPLQVAKAKVEIEKLLKAGVIVESDSPYSSPAFFIPKRDSDECRMVVDYRSVNKIIKDNAYPLPHLGALVDKISAGFVITHLDMCSAYHQLPLTADSQPITAFGIFSLGLYEFRCLPFGLKIATSAFQSLINKILRPVLNDFVYCYLDDLAVVSDSFESHVVHLNTVFKLLRDANLKLNWKKGRYFKHETLYLGFTIGGGQIKVAKERTGAILNFPRPKTVTQIQQFVGMLSWYRRFLINLSERVEPLIRLTRKNEKFVWGVEQQRAFDELKNSLVSPLVLKSPDMSLPFELHCDASTIGIGCALVQVKEEVEHPIGFFSRLLTPTQRNYSTTELELLAVLRGVHHFNHFIINGRTTKIVTDHSSLLWLCRLSNPNGRLTRWKAYLLQFDLEIVHRSGRLNVVPDCLSRSPVSINLLELNLLNSFKTTRDQWYLKLRDKILQDPNNYKQFFVSDGLIVKTIRHNKTLETINTYLVPTDCRKNVLGHIHESIGITHPGQSKTFHLVTLQFFWPKMRIDCNKFVRQCHTCQIHKCNNQPPVGLMLEKTYTDECFDCVAIDILGPLPLSSKQNRFIIVLADRFSKFIIARAVRAATTDKIIEFLKNDVILAFSAFQTIISDNGSVFCSRKYQEFINSIGAKSHLISRYYPQHNFVERHMKTIKTVLAILTKDNQRTWCSWVPHVVNHIRCTVNDTLGVEPARLVFGRLPRLLSDVQKPMLHGQIHSIDPIDYLANKVAYSAEIREKVKKSFEQAKKVQRLRYNLRRKENKFKVGDLVVRLNYAKSSALDFITRKLCDKFVGPFKISHMVGNTCDLVSLDTPPVDCGKWHCSQLKPYILPE